MLHYVKNICKHSLPCLGIFHLELPKCLHSFWGCGKEVLGPQKWSFPAWWVYTDNAGSPGAHRAWLWESPWKAPGPTAKSPFPGQTDKHLPEECQKRKVECPSEVSKPHRLLMDLQSMARSMGRCCADQLWPWAAAGSQLSHPGQVCECSRPVLFSKICDCFPKTLKAPKYLAGSVSLKSCFLCGFFKVILATQFVMVKTGNNLNVYQQ